MKIAVFLLFCATFAPAQNLFPSAHSSQITIANVPDTPRDVKLRHLWIASIFAMSAATATDAYSSWHKRETNSFLASSDGDFGAKGVAIKAGIASAVLIPQVLLRRHKDWHLPFAASNFLEAGIFAGATAHNFQVK